MSCENVFTDNPEWDYAAYDEMTGDSTLTLWNDYIFIYAAGDIHTKPNLAWIRPDKSVGHTDLREISYTDVASYLPRAYVTSDIIYIPCNEGIYKSPIPELF